MPCNKVIHQRLQDLNSSYDEKIVGYNSTNSMKVLMQNHSEAVLDVDANDKEESLAAFKNSIIQES